jgi:hypothetical protein
MEFFINKNSSLPLLKMELIQDGRNDFHKFFEKIQNADIYFTMTDVVTGVKRIAKRKAGTQLVLPQSDCTGEEYYITYKFNSKETSVAARYIGQFEIVFLDGTGTLIVPIRESLYINVLDQGILKSC